MIIEKILALLALLSTLTGCAGAEAASLPPSEDDADMIPYVQSASPGVSGEEADSTESGSDESAAVSTESGSDETAASTENSYGEAAVSAENSYGETAASAENSYGETAASAENSGEPAASPDSGEADAAESGAKAHYTLSASYRADSPLRTRKDYGPLLPYAGGTSGSYALWGMVTADGQVVTDPIYSCAKPYGPFFLLFRGGGDSGIAPELTLCGGDGSWTMDAGDFHHSMLLDGAGLAAARKDGSVIIVAENGRITQTFTREQLEPYLGAGFSWDSGDGRELIYAGGPIAVCRWDENSPYGNGTRYDCFLDIETGEVSGEPPAGFAPENGWGDPEEEPYFPGYQYPERVEDSATGEVYYWGELNGRYNLLDSEGHVLLADFFTPGHGLWEPVIGAGLVGTIRNGAFQFAEIDSGTVVFRYPLQG